MLSSFSCVQLCDSMARSQPGFSVHGIFQARLLECIAVPSKGSSWCRHNMSLMFPALAGEFFTTSTTLEARSQSFSSVQSLSRVWLCNPMNRSTPGLPVHHQLPVYSNSCPSSRWCHPAISSSVVPFSSCPQSLSASGSFPMRQLFPWGRQSIGVSASASVLPVNTQDWSPLGWTGWISLQSKGLSRVFSSTTVQKHRFFSAQLSSQSNSHIHTWPREKP